MSTSNSSIVEIAASPVPGEALLPMLLPRFRELEPAVMVRESVGDTQGVVDSWRGGRLS